MTIDSEMNVIVVDCESHRVLKFSPDGTFLASSRSGKLMEHGSEVGEFNRPKLHHKFPSGAENLDTVQLLVDDKQIVIGVDTDAHRCLKITISNALLTNLSITDIQVSIACQGNVDRGC